MSQDGASSAASKFALKARCDALEAQQDGTRVHLVGTLVNADQLPAVMRGILDDGSGSIPIRIFSTNSPLAVGDIIRVIGRLRVQDERYVACDIAKKIDDLRWLQVWRLETASSAPHLPDLISLIRTLDSGMGAPLDQVIAQSGLADATQRIEAMKTRGEIFETRPGMLKVLE